MKPWRQSTEWQVQKLEWVVTMISCASCNTDLPDNAVFCSSCGHPVENETELKAPNEIDRAWLMEVFASDGYECEEDNEKPNLFWAKHKERMNLSVTLFSTVNLLSIVGIWNVRRSRKDESRVCDALNTFNGNSVFWVAWLTEPTTLGVSASFTLGARTSARSLRKFLSDSEAAFGDNFRRAQFDKIFV